MRRLVAVAGLLPVLLGATGCRLVRSLIDTQPVVEVRREEYARPVNVVGGRAVLYESSLPEGDPDPDLALLLQHAPLLVQGAADGSDYDPSSDEIGTPHLSKALGVSIDTSCPSLFGRVEKETVGAREAFQLVYVFWYPRRPVGVVQKGEIDGGVFRVTLDAAGRPAVYEFAQTCGCLHGVFVRENVEAWAAEEFHGVEDGKRHFTERHAVGGHDWVVRDVVAGVEPAVRPVVFLSAGGHECVALQTTEVVIGFPDCDRRRADIRPYDDLTRLPVDGESGRTASMFDDEGKVRGACRSREEAVFSDLDHPGWPRHLDRMRIMWDECDWNDPRLLETYLRLPRGFQEPQAVASRLGGTGAAPAEEPLPSEVVDALRDGKPVALFFTHRLCSGCKAVEEEVIPSPSVVRAREGWTWLEVELQDEAGRSLANRYRVDATPTLVALDRNGVEQRRIVGISTVRQFEEALGQRP